MKQKIQFFLVAIALAVVGCGSDRTNNNDKDSLMTDTAVIDTADLKASPADTTVGMGKEDSVSQNTGLVTQ